MRDAIKLWLWVIDMMPCASVMFAQDGSRQRISREELAQVQAKRIAKQLAFNEQKSKKLEEAYCQCQSEIWQLGPRLGKQASLQPADTTEAAVEQNLKQRFERSQKILDIREKYFTIYSAFLTPKQIEKVYMLEKEAMEQLAKRNGAKNRK